MVGVWLFVLVGIGVSVYYFWKVYRKKSKAEEVNLSGEAEEKIVEQLLTTLPPIDYLSLHGLFIPISEGETKKLPHLVISIYGIFVIDIKDSYGEVQGCLTDEYWNRSYKGKWYLLYNPVRSNQRNIEGLQGLFRGVKVPEYAYINLVLFNPDLSLHVFNTENHHVPIKVINRQDLLGVFEEFKEPLLTYEEANHLYQLIRAYHSEWLKKEQRKKEK